MHNDDRPIGRLLSRRRALALFGASAAHRAGAPAVRRQPAPLAAARAGLHRAAPSRPRARSSWTARSSGRISDSIRRPARQAGRSLALRFDVSRVTAAGACVVLADAQVDIWHCDALGVYSDVREIASEHGGASSCAAIRSDRPTGSSASRRSIQAGIRAARCTFISRFARQRPERPDRRVHVAAVFQRRADRSRARGGSVFRAPGSASAEFARHDFPRRRNAAGAAGRWRLTAAIRRRFALPCVLANHDRRPSVLAAAAALRSGQTAFFRPALPQTRLLTQLGR